MGLWRSQVAHRTLNPAVVGSNPSRPASLNYRIFFVSLFCQQKLKSLGTGTFPISLGVMNSKAILLLSNLKAPQQHEPLELFCHEIKSKEIKEVYRKTLREFLNSVEDFQGFKIGDNFYENQTNSRTKSKCNQNFMR